MKKYEITGPHITLHSGAKVLLDKNQAKAREGLVKLIKENKNGASIYEVLSDTSFKRGQTVTTDSEFSKAVAKNLKSGKKEEKNV